VAPCFTHNNGAQSVLVLVSYSTTPRGKEMPHTMPSFNQIKFCYAKLPLIKLARKSLSAKHCGSFSSSLKFCESALVRQKYSANLLWSLVYSGHSWNVYYLMCTWNVHFMVLWHLVVLHREWKPQGRGLISLHIAPNPSSIIVWTFSLYILPLLWVPFTESSH
jgi:hypothetical protein